MKSTFALFVLLPTFVAASPFEFEHDDRISVVRIFTAYDDLHIDLLVPDADLVRCLLFDPNGAPIAVADGHATAGVASVRAEGLRPSDVEEVRCQKERRPSS